MSSRHLLLAATLLTAPILSGGFSLAIARNTATYDAGQLPEIKGKVAEYSLTPRGDVDGLILTDGPKFTCRRTWERSWCWR